MLRVSSVTEVASPPMMPARLSTCSPATTTPTLGSSATAWPLSSSSVSPSRAQRTERSPPILSRSNTCEGRPTSSMT
ncbi:Uncharacterised protein [Bordetella pertussis]|nr:Uncharacterised protein [Bordetella pertussis]